VLALLVNGDVRSHKDCETKNEEISTNFVLLWSVDHDTSMRHSIEKKKKYTRHSFECLVELHFVFFFLSKVFVFFRTLFEKCFFCVFSKGTFETFFGFVFVLFRVPYESPKKVLFRVPKQKKRVSQKLLLFTSVTTSQISVRRLFLDLGTLCTKRFFSTFLSTNSASILPKRLRTTKTKHASKKKTSRASPG